VVQFKVMVMIASIALLTGCVFGPFEATHEEGSKPKFRLNTYSDDVKIRARRRHIWIEYEKEF